MMSCYGTFPSLHVQAWKPKARTAVSELAIFWPEEAQ